MRQECDIVVIGGGATGTGVVRDVAMRGFSAILVERADLGQGTTGRYHGLLHSGGRYVVSDPESARECAAENLTLGRIHAHAVERTGGLFVVTPEDDLEFSDQFWAGCQTTGVEAEEISPAAALEREPRLNPGIKRAFAVNDGSIDGWEMVWGTANSARDYGATILTYHSVVGVQVRDGQVCGVECINRRTGERVQIDCQFVINAAGPWSGQVTAMAGCHDLEVVPGRGVMVAMSHRLVNSVVNRCVYPADGGIIVPVHTVSIIGTTDVKAEDPDQLIIPTAEVQQMLDAGEVLIPGFRQARALHAWAGARPLVKDTRVSASDTRHMSRGMSVLDHAERDQVKGMLTVAGGKLTTYRLMAEKIVDQMCAQLGEQRPCRTAEEAVPGSTSQQTYLLTHRLHEREQERYATNRSIDDQIICECELITRRMLTQALRETPRAALDDLRRRLRLGMGPCQGGFCSLRAVGIGCTEQVFDAETASSRLTHFLDNRWIGLWPILYGDQVRQTALDEWILQGTLDIDHLPPTEISSEKVPLTVATQGWADPTEEAAS